MRYLKRLKLLIVKRLPEWLHSLDHRWTTVSSREMILTKETYNRMNTFRKKFQHQSAEVLQISLKDRKTVIKSNTCNSKSTQHLRTKLILACCHPSINSAPSIMTLCESYPNPNSLWLLSKLLKILMTIVVIMTVLIIVGKSSLKNIRLNTTKWFRSSSIINNLCTSVTTLL